MLSILLSENYLDRWSIFTWRLFSYNENKIIKSSYHNRKLERKTKSNPQLCLFLTFEWFNYSSKLIQKRDQMYDFKSCEFFCLYISFIVWLYISSIIIFLSHMRYDACPFYKYRFYQSLYGLNFFFSSH